jgi:hypothetical protein
VLATEPAQQEGDRALAFSGTGVSPPLPSPLAEVMSPFCS